MKIDSWCVGAGADLGVHMVEIVRGIIPGTIDEDATVLVVGIGAVMREKEAAVGIVVVGKEI